MGISKKVTPKDPLAVEIGRRIRAARLAKKWRLEDLETHSGLLLKRLGNYETGLRMPGPAEILAIANATGDAPAYLMALADDQKPQEVRNSTEGALLELFRQVDPEYREQTLQRLGSIAFLKKDGIPDEQLEHLSAKGKPQPLTKARRLRGARVARASK